MATRHYLNQWWLVCRSIYASLGLNELTNCGILTFEGDTGLSQHWPSLWFVVWHHKAITWRNVDLSSARLNSWGIFRKRYISHQYRKLGWKFHLHIYSFKFLRVYGRKCADHCLVILVTMWRISPQATGLVKSLRYDSSAVFRGTFKVPRPKHVSLYTYIYMNTSICYHNS